MAAGVCPLLLLLLLEPPATFASEIDCVLCSYTRDLCYIGHVDEHCGLACLPSIAQALLAHGVHVFAMYSTGAEDTGLGTADFGWGTPTFLKMGLQRVSYNWFCRRLFMRGSSGNPAPYNQHNCACTDGWVCPICESAYAMQEPILAVVGFGGWVLVPKLAAYIYKLPCMQVHLARKLADLGLDFCISDVDTVWIRGVSAKLVG